MTSFPWSKFFWADWESDQALRLCSLAAQGLWMRLLCVCARGEPYGYLCIQSRALDVSDVARLVGIQPTEADDLMSELERNGVYSRDRRGRVFSRRLVRDKKRSDEGRKHKKRGLEQAAEKKEENNDPSRGASRGASPQKPEARSQKREDTASAASSQAPPRGPATGGFLDRLRDAANAPEAGDWIADPLLGVHVARWRALGLTDAEMLAVAAAKARGRQIGSPGYLDGAMADFAGRKRAPPLAPTPGSGPGRTGAGAAGAASDHILRRVLG